MSAPSAVHAAALAARAAGLNPVPPRQDGSKAPVGEWKDYQARAVTAEEQDRWYANGRTGVGLICGAISGGLELLEFEGRAIEAGLGEAFIDAAEACGLADLVGRVAIGYTEATPSGGLHWLYRTSEPKSTVLARTPEGPPLIETKGEGGFVIVAPSCGSVHPTGRAWRLVTGGFDTIAAITAEERDALHSLARTFDQRPRPAKADPAGQAHGDHGRTTRAEGDVLPGEDFNDRATWAEILKPHGWLQVATIGDNEHWRRPGKAIGTSATISDKGAGVLFVFTSSTAFEPGISSSGVANTSYSKFAAYAVLNHNGDYSEAARALYAARYGTRRESEKDGRERGAGRDWTEDEEDEIYTDAPDEEAEAVIDALGAMAAPGPVEPGYAVLDVAVAFLDRFVAFPSKAAADAVALWAMFSHAIDAFDTSPRLNLMSAEKRSGKSRTLEVLELLVRRPAMTSTMTAAVVFRQVDAMHPTLLMDEVDAVFSKGKDDRNEELRGLLNAGQRRGVPAYRCSGPKMTEVKAYDAFSAVVLAGIGDLPSTIADRSIRIEMKRRAPGEEVERFRRRKVAPAAAGIKKRMATWAAAQVDALAGAEPVLPDELDDRAQDGWEPLLAIADAAGADWPRRARRAAIELSAGRTADEDTIGVRLLADIATVFGTADRLSSADLAARLAGLEEAPWAVWRKGPPAAPLDARVLARMLKPYGVKPKLLRVGDLTFRGYERADFADAWTRYGSSVSKSASEPLQPLHRRSEPLFDPLHLLGADTPETAPDLRCNGVTDKTPLQGTGHDGNGPAEDGPA